MVINTSRSLVCHLIYRFDIGGLERVMVNCINAMQENNIEHVVIALTEIGDFSKHLNPNVKTYQLNKKSGKDLASHWRLFKLLRQLKPDILHTYNLAALEYHPIAKLAGVKGHIHAEHGREISDPLGVNKKHNLLRKLISPFIHYFVPVSTDIEEWLVDVVNIDRGKVKLVHNGIDIDKFSFKKQLHSACQSRDVLDRHSRGVLDGNPELKTIDSGLCDNRNDDGSDNRNDDGCDNRKDDGCDNRKDDGCDNRNDDGSACHSQDVLDRHSRGVLDGNPELKTIDSGLCDNRNDDGSDNRNDDGCDNLNDDVCDNRNDERCIRFIHIARFNPVKDQQNLINAFALLVQENAYLPEQVCLTLVGDGDLTNELKQLVVDKKLNDFVIFTGARDDIPALLKSADIFVLSSVAEGIPMTILEAMAASLPIISTDVGGLSELVENGVSGLLVEKQNATALANAMHTYVKNPQLIKPQGEQAHQFIEKNFSEAAMINAYQNLYLQSLGQ